ncbi:hypothetical protein PM082_020682 [Marasmius tenuissimus]|nr:hypothetical protein PM082_020682 [Marasmius tenuissimus]
MSGFIVRCSYHSGVRNRRNIYKRSPYTRSQFPLFIKLSSSKSKCSLSQHEMEQILR